jgi:hypothetical protein
MCAYTYYTITQANIEPTAAGCKIREGAQTKALLWLLNSNRLASSESVHNYQGRLSNLVCYIISVGIAA